MRRNRIAAALRRFAPREQIVEQLRQNRRFAAKARAAGCFDQIRIGRRIGRERERIDVERADQARIQTLEVEHPHVVVHARPRFEHVATGLRREHARVVAAHARRNDAALVELGEIQEVERRDAGGDAIRSHAGEFAARHRQRDQIQFLADLERKPRIGTGIQREARQILLVPLHDLADAIVRVAFQRLAFAQHFARHRIERVVVEAHERAADQIDAVEHEPPRNAGAAAAEITARRSHAQTACVAAEFERMPHALRDAREHR